MSSPTEAWQPLLDGLGQMRGAWPGGAWSWDPRFKCLNSSFVRDIADRARQAMTGVLDAEWAAATINQAPDEIRTLAARFGGVREGQLLFTGNAVDGRMHLFALWWPWGDGATISLRVGVANCDRPTELYPQIRALFNIA